MRVFLKCAAITVIVMTVLTFPVKEDVTIIKSQITHNQPFAGRINGQVVGTYLCVEYWLNKDKQPDSITYRITKPLVFQILGYIHSYKPLKH